MAVLTDKVKEFIVTRHAMYDTPKQIMAALKEEFGLELSRQQVSNYNPKNSIGRRGDLSRKLIALYTATRAKFDETIDDIPIAQRSYRLRKLGQMFDHAFDKGAFVVAAGLLEQAAKEVGETFTNKREHKVSGTLTVNDELSTDDKRTALVDRMADAANTLRAAASNGPPTIQ